MRKRSSPICTAWLAVSVAAPFAGLISRPMALVGAVFVLFALVIAGLDLAA